MNERAPYSSPCPRCHQSRVMDGATRGDLIRKLNSGEDIGAWCSTCDEHWSLSAEERDRLARGLAEGR
jgi:hypothetical protein